MTVAIATLFWGCAIAPSPSTAPASASPVPPFRVAFVAWEVRGGDAELLTFTDDGATSRRPLPAVPNGGVSTALPGRLGFASGSPTRPALWTASPLLPAWQSQALTVPAGNDQQFRGACVAAPSTTMAALQLDGGVVFVTSADGALRRLESGTVAARPDGCVWMDEGHVLAAFDRIRPPGVIGLALFALDGSAPIALDGTAGEEPTRSTSRLAYVAHDPDGGSSIVVTNLPGPDGPVPQPIVRLGPAQRTYLRPVLSADGTRLALLALGPASDGRHLLLFDLRGSGATVLADVNVSDVDDAGPAWVADPPGGG